MSTSACPAKQDGERALEGPFRGWASRATMPILRRTVFRRALGRGDPHQGPSHFFFDEVRSEDTYLVSFPRSGNTFLRHLVACLLLDRAPTPADIARLVPDVHRSPPGRPPVLGPLIAKSHAPARAVPAKVVYIVRDGRAALLSYHEYLRRRGRPVPSSVDAMLSWPDVWPRPWSDHVTGWLGQLEQGQGGTLVRYEDLVDDPAGVLRRVAGVAGLAGSDDAVARAVERSSLDAMRSAERDAADGSLNFVGLSRRQWSEVFSRESLARFESACGPLLARLGYPLSSPGA